MEDRGVGICDQARKRVLALDVAGILGDRIDAVASMDKLMHGPPDVWPDQVLAVGTPVWVAVPGLERLGVMPGVIDYSDVHRDRNTQERSGYVALLVKRELPLTGQSTYAKVHDGTFWPRSEEVVTQPNNMTELIGLG